MNIDVSEGNMWWGFTERGHSQVAVGWMDGD